MTPQALRDDCLEALRLLSELGISGDLEREAKALIADMHAGGRGVTPDELRRYADAIDWSKAQEPKLLQQLTQVLLRLVAGLATGPGLGDAPK